ncbi:hypothetical protein EG329_006230 [Mollisiaceae sp. DMI_Dod_QoI]|nr:hypothetical protein EG329_006230 [Helotiales sp. DMI_Dod_QoI]
MAPTINQTQTLLNLPIEVQYMIFDEIIALEPNRIIDLAGPEQPDDPRKFDNIGQLSWSHLILQEAIDKWLQFRPKLKRIGPQREICDPNAVTFCLDLRAWRSIPYNMRDWEEYQRNKKKVASQAEWHHLVWLDPDVLEYARRIQIHVANTDNFHTDRDDKFGDLARVMKVLPKLLNLERVDFVSDPRIHPSMNSASGVAIGSRKGNAD